MTPKQRNFFFVDLWPKACRAQGWVGTTECEVKRRFVIKQATTELFRVAPKFGHPTDSLKACSGQQLTAVFNLVKHLGQPANLKAARAAANPAEAAAQNECRQLVWKIRDVAKRDVVKLHEAYIQKIAAWERREAQVGDWTELPADALKRVLVHVNQRANDKDPEVHQRGPNKPKSRVTEQGQVAYQMRPSKIFVPKPKPEAVASDNCPY